MNVSKKIVFSLFVFMLLIILIASYIFIDQTIKYNNELSLFQKNELGGKISKITSEGKGLITLEIDGKKICTLPIAYEVEKFNIRIGDSLLKKPNSSILTIYKSKEINFEKLCEIQIYSANP